MQRFFLAIALMAATWLAASPSPQGDPGGQHQGGVRQVVSAPTCQCNEGFGNAHEGERSALTTNTASQKPHHYANGGARPHGRGDRVMGT
jgi:hypothetical protein